MRSGRLALLVGLLAVTPALFGAEVRVVRFYIQPDFSPPPCLSLAGWFSQTFFHNSTDTTQTVRLLGVSNGSARADAEVLSISPHQTAELIGSDLNWNPTPGSILWVDRLDVPPGVVVANRVASGIYDVSSDTTGSCIPKQTFSAGLPLPVVGTLIPPGMTQYFLGTDVGSDVSGNRITDARVNVGVYNGGSVSASATVSIYCGQVGPSPSAANALVMTDRIQVPANSVFQKTVLPSTQTGCPVGGVESFFYATVTADQPSFAYAIGLG